MYFRVLQALNLIHFPSKPEIQAASPVHSVHPVHPVHHLPPVIPAQAGIQAECLSVMTFSASVKDVEMFPNIESEGLQPLEGIDLFAGISGGLE